MSCFSLNDISLPHIPLSPVSIFASKNQYAKLLGNNINVFRLNMSLEIQSAVNFIVHLVRISKHNNINEYHLKKFNTALVEHLQQRFHDHWNPEHPFRGSGYRCIRINKTLDMNIRLAGESVGLSLDILYCSLPKDLIIWIDPKEVSFRIKETGRTCIIYDNDLHSWQPTTTKKKKTVKSVFCI